MLLTSSAFGAYSFGSDIDGRQLRGKTTNIIDNADQYGVRDRLIDTTSFDLNQHPFRCGELFDAIITDPPYGVRAVSSRPPFLRIEQCGRIRLTRSLGFALTGRQALGATRGREAGVAKHRRGKGSGRLRTPVSRCVPDIRKVALADLGPLFHRFVDYVPPSIPWEMTEVINTLITYSLYLLKPGGRLVFFLPTDNVSLTLATRPRFTG